MSALTIRDVTYSYRGRYGTTHVLKGVTHDFARGEICAVVGKSGSGKTTLLSLMAGLELPDGGDVLANGQNTRTADLDQYRRERVAVVYQNFRLFPLLTVLENVMYPLELGKTPKTEARERALACIERVGLPAAYADRFPSMLSGGEQQRVAIARALVTQTGILLADEPTGNLDEETSKKIIDILSDLAHTEQYCVVVVTHDLGILDKMDAVLKMQDGKLVPLTV